MTCRCDTSAAMKSLSASLKTRYRSIIETSQNIKTRHRASTSMYSLTFCVRFLSPERHQWKARSPDYRSNVENARRWRPVAGRRRAQTSPSRPFALCRHIAGWTQACNYGSRCCHSNATRAPIVNPPSSAQLGGSLYHAPKLHPGPCSSVGVRPRTDRQTDRHTDARDHNTFCVVYDSRKM